MLVVKVYFMYTFIDIAQTKLLNILRALKTKVVLAKYRYFP